MNHMRWQHPHVNCNRLLPSAKHCDCHSQKKNGITHLAFIRKMLNVVSHNCVAKFIPVQVEMSNLFLLWVFTKIYYVLLIVSTLLISFWWSIFSHTSVNFRATTLRNSLSHFDFTRATLNHGIFIMNSIYYF